MLLCLHLNSKKIVGVVMSLCVHLYNKCVGVVMSLCPHLNNKKCSYSYVAVLTYI